MFFQTDFFCEIFEIAAVQKDANLVELEKCCQTHIFLQNIVLIQPRTTPPKICKIKFLQKTNYCKQFAKNCKKLQNIANFAKPNPNPKSPGARRPRPGGPPSVLGPGGRRLLGGPRPGHRLEEPRCFGAAHLAVGSTGLFRIGLPEV